MKRANKKQWLSKKQTQILLPIRHFTLLSRVIQEPLRQPLLSSIQLRRLNQQKYQPVQLLTNFRWKSILSHFFLKVYDDISIQVLWNKPKKKGFFAIIFITWQIGASKIRVVLTIGHMVGELGQLSRLSRWQIVFVNYLKNTEKCQFFSCHQKEKFLNKKILKIFPQCKKWLFCADIMKALMREFLNFFRLQKFQLENM